MIGLLIVGKYLLVRHAKITSLKHSKKQCFVVELIPILQTHDQFGVNTPMLQLKMPAFFVKRRFSNEYPRLTLSKAFCELREYWKKRKFLESLFTFWNHAENATLINRIQARYHTLLQPAYTELLALINVEHF